MTWLKQSTVVTVQLGAFLDATDGVVPETGLATNMDSATTGIRVSKNGAVMIDRNSATVPAHDDDGHYRIVLSATDTDTLGTLRIQYEESGVTTPAWRDFMVVPANVWDSFFGADALQVDQVEIVGTAVPAPTTAGVPDVNVERWLDTLVTLSASTPDVNVQSLDGNVITAASINAAALNGKGDWNIGKSGYALTLADWNVGKTGYALTTADWNVGKTGYSLSQAFPANFADLSIVATSGLVDITQAAADKVWATAARILTASTNFNDVSAAEVLTQVNAALDATIAELGVTQPATTPTLRTAMMLVYMALRNRTDTFTSGADALRIYNDAGTIITTKALSDDGSDYSEAKMA